MLLENSQPCCDQETQVCHIFAVSKKTNKANHNTERLTASLVQAYPVAYNLSAAGWSLVLYCTLAHLFAVSTAIFSPMFSPHSHAFQGLHQSRLAGMAQAGGPSMATLSLTCPGYRKWTSSLSSQAVVVTRAYTTSSSLLTRVRLAWASPFLIFLVQQ